jgi:hypothetical protein
VSCSVSFRSPLFALAPRFARASSTSSSDEMPDFAISVDHRVAYIELRSAERAALVKTWFENK